jgi:hypothetical protein
MSTEELFMDPMEDPRDPVSDENSQLVSALIDAIEIVSKIPKIFREGESKSVTRKQKEEVQETAAKAIASLECTIKNIKSNLFNVPQSQAASQNTNESLKSIENLIQTSFQNLTKSLQNQTSFPPSNSYASVLKTNNQNSAKKPIIPKTKPAIIVSSKKEVGSSTETMQHWRQSVQFTDTNFAPANVKFVSNNKLRVEFDTEEQRRKTLDKIADNKSSSITAEESKLLKPMVIIKGISQAINTNEICNIIIKQNTALNNTKPEDLSFRFKRGNRNKDLYNAVLITTPQVWKLVTKIGKVNLDHQRVVAEDYVPLMQCYNCLQFGHTKKRCTSDTLVCSHCSGVGHVFATCPSKQNKDVEKCHNCTKYNSKNSSNATTQHSATSNRCPQAQYMTNIIRNKTNYG